MEFKSWLKKLDITLKTEPSILAVYTKWLTVHCTQVFGTLKTVSRSFILKISQIVRKKTPEVKRNAKEKIQPKTEEAGEGSPTSRQDH